jgi:hypothetical protein
MAQPVNLLGSTAGTLITCVSGEKRHFFVVKAAQDDIDQDALGFPALQSFQALSGFVERIFRP